MQDILSFKDTIARWNVHLPQRFKGDRLVNDVKHNLITPLRKIENQSRSELRRLERAEQDGMIKREYRERKSQEEDSAKWRNEAAKLREERWEKWQELYTERLNVSLALSGGDVNIYTHDPRRPLKRGMPTEYHLSESLFSAIVRPHSHIARNTWTSKDGRISNGRR